MIVHTIANKMSDSILIQATRKVFMHLINHEIKHSSLMIEIIILSLLGMMDFPYMSYYAHLIGHGIGCLLSTGTQAEPIGPQ
jgi:hypothetical protein